MKTDKQLQDDVIAELEWDPAVDSADIGVAVIDGVVSLNGYVPSYSQKLAAERAAKRCASLPNPIPRITRSPGASSTSSNGTRWSPTTG